MKLCIVVTHLLGTGHLRRAAVLGRAAARAGADVTILSGGMPVTGLETGNAWLVQLPPLRSDGVDFSTLLDDTGTPASDAYKTQRSDRLAQEITAFAPDVLLTELYPFGRRGLAHEFTTAIQTARGLPRPAAVAASIRDILAPPSKPKRVVQTEAVLAEYYDAVLVHSDPDVVPLSASWPVSPFLQERLRYTGFVAPPAPSGESGIAGQGDILVSAGGGAVGRNLFEKAVQAARLMPGQKFRLLVGGQDAEVVRASLVAEAPDNVTVEGLRPDFRNLLARAACSLSLCGYNTAMDILQTGVPALFVPFDDGNEVEQTLRARCLSRLSGIDMMIGAEITAQSLAARLGALCATQRRPVSSHQFDGAMRSIEFLEDLAHARAA